MARAELSRRPPHGRQGARWGFGELAGTDCGEKPRNESYERTRTMSGPSGTSDRTTATMGAVEVDRFTREDMADGNVRQVLKSSSWFCGYAHHVPTVTPLRMCSVHSPEGQSSPSMSAVQVWEQMPEPLNT